MTKKDNEFLMKIVKRQDSLEERVKSLELAKSEPQEPVKSPFQLEMLSSDAHTETHEAHIDKSQHIEAVFRNRSSDVDTTAQQTLLEAIYATLKELCLKNNIQKLKVTIDNTSHENFTDLED